MKKFALIVLVLIAVLLAVAFVTKPGDAQLSLTHVVILQLPPQEATIIQSTGGETVVSKKVAEKVTFKDRIFWVDAQVADKSVFIGAFGHWYPRVDAAYKAIVDIENFKDKALNELNNVKKDIPALPGPVGDKVKDAEQDLTKKIKIPGT